MEKKKISKKQAEKVLAQQDLYVGMILESMNEKLKTLVDGQEILHGRVDGLGGSMGRMEGKLENMEGQLDGMNIRIERVEDQLDGVDIRLDQVENQLGEVNMRVERVEGQLGRMEVKLDTVAEEVREKASKEEVADLGHRVTRLEA